MKPLFLIIALGVAIRLFAQSDNFTTVTAEVDFSRSLRIWDGFGVNYVECAQTFNYQKYPQDYGGFDVLSEADKEKIIDLVFGDNGLKPNILKMFLDPLHQQARNGEFDHRTTTKSMRYFASNGYKLVKDRHDTLNVISTLYGPPAYITKQKIIRGRDLDPDRKKDLCNYMIDWARFLKIEEGLPVKYISLHNEGESWLRFPQDGTLGSTAEEGHDYNFFWPPSQVNEITVLLRKMLDSKGLKDVGITNGETTNWYRFTYWGYADRLFEDENALDATAIITSHGFYVGGQESGRWFGPHSSGGIDLLRTKRPGMEAWCTSTSWDVKDKQLVVDGKIERRCIMNAGFVKEIHGNIYEAKVNAIIPWALIQKASDWNKPDPNPGSAFRVYDDGTWEIKKGYYYYKQVTTAGRCGMSVVATNAMDSEIALIGFGKNNTNNDDAFVLVNFGSNNRLVNINIEGTKVNSLSAFRTSGQEVYDEYQTANPHNLDGSENYSPLTDFIIEKNHIQYEAPANSVTTFFIK